MATLLQAIWPLVGEQVTVIYADGHEATGKLAHVGKNWSVSLEGATFRMAGGEEASLPRVTIAPQHIAAVRPLKDLVAVLRQRDESAGRAVRTRVASSITMGQRDGRGEAPGAAARLRALEEHWARGGEAGRGGPPKRGREDDARDRPGAAGADGGGGRFRSSR